VDSAERPFDERAGDLPLIRRFTNYFIHVMVFADECFNMRRVRSSNYELPPFCRRAAAEMLNSFPLASFGDAMS
jgi:hypothetical protein